MSPTRAALLVWRGAAASSIIGNAPAGGAETESIGELEFFRFCCGHAAAVARPTEGETVELDALLLLLLLLLLVLLEELAAVAETRPTLTLLLLLPLLLLAVLANRLCQLGPSVSVGHCLFYTRWTKTLLKPRQYKDKRSACLAEPTSRRTCRSAYASRAAWPSPRLRGPPIPMEPRWVAQPSCGGRPRRWDAVARLGPQWGR